MKRWDFATMMTAARKLFASIHRQKHLANPNHDVHLMARNINDWLSEGIQSIINGTYTPRCLKRYYFKDEMIDQLHLSDRILQNLLLKQLKLTFTHVMNPNCYHLHGPSGVKLATQRIKQVLAEQKPKYIIRADIKSYYKSIQHHLLIQDVKRYYSDPNVQSMLENIIKNPIETPRGYKNADNGIALRGPLSQFFSGLYLKPLDDAFDTMDVTYLRYQDDILILCQTKRQLERCKQRLMDVLHERRLRLSRKKTRIGSIDKSFHFLGINYLEPQLPDGTNVSQNSFDSANQKQSERYLTSMGGGRTVRHQLVIQILCIKRSFRMRERYEMHANKLSKWLLMESLSAESGVT
ncbi:reverse transcriptase domain-containing protein [Legionella pneumophila serogroup 10]